MFDGETCVNNALDFCLKLKGESEKLLILKLLKIIYNSMLITDQVSIRG